jgi:acetyl esterase/lipase
VIIFYLTRISFLYTLIVFLFFACGEKPRNSTGLDENESYCFEDIKYGPSHQNTLDLYLPAGRNNKTPVLIFIHGGAWVHGDKSQFYKEYAEQLAGNQWVIANMNYRLVSDSFNIKHVLEDIDRTVNFLSEKSSGYGIRSGNFHLIGNSAGGHIALLYGYLSGSKKKISSVISISGPTNLNDRRFKNLMDTGWNSSYIYPLLLGAPFEENGKEAIDGSPLYQKYFLPTFLIHGTNDLTVPFYQAQQLSDSLERKNVKYRLLKLEGAGHNVLGENDQQINEAIKEWILQFD